MNDLQLWAAEASSCRAEVASSSAEVKVVVLFASESYMREKVRS